MVTTAISLFVINFAKTFRKTSSQKPFVNKLVKGQLVKPGKKCFLCVGNLLTVQLNKSRKQDSPNFKIGLENVQF